MKLKRYGLRRRKADLEVRDCDEPEPMLNVPVTNNKLIKRHNKRSMILKNDINYHLV